jgi:hypothetical protein
MNTDKVKPKTLVPFTLKILLFFNGLNAQANILRTINLNTILGTGYMLS